MKLSGYLSEYSLAEIFNFIHEGNQTGLLTLFVKNSLSTSSIDNIQYVWFRNGRIISVTNGLGGTELLTKIIQRKLISPEKIEPIGASLYQLDQPLGLYLKSCNLLDAGQLKLLFNSQTLVPISKLFEVKDRQFLFEPNKLPINAELIGISSSTQEVGLMGLRLLKDWSGLSAKLPDSSYAVKRCFSHQPDFELGRSELQLWTLADGKTPLDRLAGTMGLSIEIVRQISYRLTTFKCLQEVPMQQIQQVNSDLTPVLASESNIQPVSNLFLGNLKKFLKIGREKSHKSSIK